MLLSKFHDCLYNILHVVYNLNTFKLCIYIKSE